MQAATSGLGVERLPTFLLHGAIESGDLQPVLLSTNWGMAGFYALFPDTTFLPHRTRAFIDFMVLRFGNEPVWDKCLKPNLKEIDKTPLIVAEPV